MNINAERSRPRRVAIYGRVSTEHEAQLSAMDNQLQWYEELAKNHPEWTVIKTYGDYESGTSANRPDFQRMLHDAALGHFDLIVTREISRFSRNILDAIGYVRELEKVGVEVYFASEGIWSFDKTDGELRLAIMATLAQEESRKISHRVKNGQGTSRQNGVYYGNGNVLGYDRHCTISDGVKVVTFTVNEEQARTVRKIFELYLMGYGVRKIKYELENLGYLTSKGNKNWHDGTISHILKNEFYVGKIVYGKNYKPDFLDKRRVLNLGEKERITVDGEHEPIISQEDFDRVQAMLSAHKQELDEESPSRKKNRAKTIGKKKPADVWTKLLECECGHRFNRHTDHTKQDGTKQYSYECYSSIRSGSAVVRKNHGLDYSEVCTSPRLAQWKLQMMAKHLFHDFLPDTQNIINFAEMLFKQAENTRAKTISDHGAEIAALDREIEKQEKRINGYIEMRADGEITAEEFKRMKSEAEAKRNTAKKQKEALLPSTAEDDSTFDYKKRLEILKAALAEYQEFDESRDIPEEVIDAFVEKIVVRADCLEWHLRFRPDPVKCTVEGTRQKGSPNPVFCLKQDRLLSRKLGNR